MQTLCEILENLNVGDLFLRLYQYNQCLTSKWWPYLRIYQNYKSTRLQIYKNYESTKITNLPADQMHSCALYLQLRTASVQNQIKSCKFYLFYFCNIVCYFFLLLKLHLHGDFSFLLLYQLCQWKRKSSVNLLLQMRKKLFIQLKLLMRIKI